MNFDSIAHARSRFDERLPELQTEIKFIDRRIRFFTVFAWVFITLGIVIFVSALTIYLLTPKDAQQFFNLDALGDFLSGSVASLWSLAGLFLIYVAFLGQKQQILHQQIELLYSQLELSHTRQELEGQKIEMKEQNITLKRQRFENTFFQLIRNLQEIISAISIDANSEIEETVSGRNSFEEIYNGLYLKIYRKPGGDVNVDLDTVMDKFEAVYKQYQSDLGHYYRSLFNIIEFIDNSRDVENKTLYSKIVRELLSSFELILLFYFSLGDLHYKKLVEKYALFKNLDSDLLFAAEHKVEFATSAFGKNA